MSLSDGVSVVALLVSAWALYLSRRHRASDKEIEAARVFGSVNVLIAEFSGRLDLAEHRVRNLLSRQFSEGNRTAIRANLDALAVNRQTLGALKAKIQQLSNPAVKLGPRMRELLNI